VAAAIDRFTIRLGQVVSWLALVMVLIGAYNAIARYLGRYIGINLSSNAYIEAQWYLFSLLFLLSAAYALQQDAHVRVDVLFSRYPPRVRCWVNILGAALLLIPFCVFMLWVSWPVVMNSWNVREVSPDPGGLPRWPLKAMVPVCFLLLIVQGVSELIKETGHLRGHGKAATEPHIRIEGA
jgi:TRAP-type mannitol/chloroaromatic compound transport system permease small subunit